MTKLYRSMLLTGLVAAGLAGCGDDVTVVEPPPPPPPPAPQIRSIEVTPDNVPVAPGQTVQMNASVTADPGVGTITITWSTSDATRATVSTTGLVTIPAAAPAGPVSIRATATATGAGTASDAATLNVTALAAAQVSINAINQGAWIGAPACAAVAGTPANLACVGGQVNVILNLERGTDQVVGIDLLIDTETGDSVFATQNFSAAPATTESEDGGPLTQSEQLTFPVNTAFFNATTGRVALVNRTNHGMKGRVRTTRNATGSVSTTILFSTLNNNTWAASLALSGTTASATNTANGLLYRRGALDVSAVPVIYTQGATFAAGSVTFGAAGCDANFGARTVALTAPAAGSFAWTASFPQTGTVGATNVAGYEYSTGLCGTGGELPVLNGTDSQGNNVFTAAAAFVPGPQPLRLDNRGPGAPTFIANPNGRQNGWINGTVGLVGLNTSATDNDWLVNGAADVGVGGYTRQLRIDASAPGTVAAANASAASSTPATPARSTNPNDYCAVASATDLLGNESTLPANATVCLAPPVGSFVATGSNHLRFGVDLDAPTIAFSGGLASNTRISAAAIGGEFQVTVADIGTIGVSGMLAGSPVIGNIQTLNGTQPGTTACFFPAAAAPCGATMASINAAPALPLVSTAGAAALTAVVVPAYYTGTFVAVDAAGNQSPSVTRSVVFDLPGNVPALTGALFNTPLTGPTVTFTAFSSDNLDLRDVQYTMTYAGGLAGPLQFPRATLNTFPPVPAALVNSNVAAGLTVNGFMRQVENVTGNAPLAVGGQFKPSQIDGTIRDVVNNTTGPVTTPIAPASVTTGVSYLTAAAAQLINSWAVTNAAANVSDGAAATPANATSVTLVADAFGPTATFNPPFTRVDFYVLSGGNLVQIGTGVQQATFDDGSAQGRRQRWTFTWTPGTTFGLGAQSIFAIGVNAAGDGLVTPVNANITITNP